MKRISKYLTLTGLSGLLCLFLAIPADAQRGGGHAGDGGGFHGGGGGSHSSGGGFSRGGGGFSGGRSSGSFSSPRSGFSRPQGTFSSPRSNNSFSSPRTNSFSSPRTNAFSSPGYRGSEHARVTSPTFRRGGVGSTYRGGYGSIRGGYYRGGRYYPGGYGRSYGRSYAYRYSPWASHYGYYYNRGFYGRLYYPRLGFSLGVLPYGYYPFWWNDLQFYYSSGYFYQYDNGQYTVVEPPIGAAVNSLPGNAQSIVINGQQYYEANGVYYTPVTKDDGTVVYQVAGKDGQLETGSPDQGSYAPDDQGYSDGGGQVAPPAGGQSAVAMPEIGDIFYSLPSDSRKIKIAGQVYYVSPDDFYYQKIQDSDGKTAYKVMGTPDNAPGE
ncbi:DUF6515 family protein [Mucilaginibacter panaciglaebae]